MSITLHKAECVSFLSGLAPNSIDACVTDPPYGLGFMGRQWDALPPGEAFAAELLRVLKPGAHAVLFGGQRTIHRLVVSLEDAGFEVRDLLGWAFWSGFPKNHDVSKAIDRMAGAEREVMGPGRWNHVKGTADQSACLIRPGNRHDITAPATPEAQRWHGFGTALKPAIEPAVLVRKPLAESSIARQVLATGTGAINIDGCRYGYGDPAWCGPTDDPGSRHCPATEARGAALSGSADGTLRQAFFYDSSQGRWPANLYYCPKASRSERERGCAGLPTMAGQAIHNHHPTVKPVRLLRWLCGQLAHRGGLPSAGTCPTACPTSPDCGIWGEQLRDLAPLALAGRGCAGRRERSRSPPSVRLGERHHGSHGSGGMPDPWRAA